MTLFEIYTIGPFYMFAAGYICDFLEKTLGLRNSLFNLLTALILAGALIWIITNTDDSMGSYDPSIEFILENDPDAFP